MLTDLNLFSAAFRSPSETLSGWLERAAYGHSALADEVSSIADLVIGFFYLCLTCVSIDFQDLCIVMSVLVKAESKILD